MLAKGWGSLTAVAPVRGSRHRRFTANRRLHLLVLALGLLAPRRLRHRRPREDRPHVDLHRDAPASLPGGAVVVTCGLVAVAIAVLQVLGRLAGVLRALLLTLFALAVVVGFIVWSAAGRELPFQLINQLQQTITLAVPLVFGALSGLGGRAGRRHQRGDRGALPCRRVQFRARGEHHRFAGRRTRGRRRGRRRDGHAARRVRLEVPGEPGGAGRRAQRPGQRRHRLPLRPADAVGAGQVQRRQCDAALRGAAARPVARSSGRCCSTRRR